MTNRGSNSISVYSNDGNGVFQARVGYFVEAGPISICAADFNGDRYNDIVVGHNDDYHVSILFNRGNGAFFGRSNYSTIDRAGSICAADFDEDGSFDLAIANLENYRHTPDILINNGHGSFTRPAFYSMGNIMTSIVALDINGDGFTDLAGASAFSSNIAILRNQGNGIFQEIESYGVGVAPMSIAVSDFDGNGINDLAVANSGSNTISILLNQLTATNSPNETIETPQKISLSQNYPNPFNATTKIKYVLLQSGNVRLTIYNILGQNIATLIDGVQAAGTHYIDWDASGCPSGPYFAKVTAGGRNESIKMMLMK